MPSKRTKFIAATAVLAGAAVLSLGNCAPSPRPQAEHVVLIVIDTLRADHLGAFGYPRDTSPALDALAREGALFRRAYSQSSFTSPSMISLMTSRYIVRERLDIPDDLPTLAESFQRAGWRTGAFVSNELLNQGNGFARGFERFEKLVDHGPNEPVESWFREVASERSFTYLHITEPHDPYLPPEGQRSHRESPDFLPGDRAQFYESLQLEMQLHDHDANLARIKEEIGGYDDEVRYADQRVQRFLAALEAAGLRANTAIAVTADHGEGLWERVALMNGQRGAKLRAGEPPSLMNTLMPTHGNQVSHELVHVPLILVAPGVPAGRHIESPVENVDLFPTLLELADIASPGALQGESLLGRIGGERSKKNYGFSFTRFNTTIISADGLQLVLPTEEGQCAEALAVELFDLNTDQHQRHNVAAERPKKVERLTKLARERMENAIQDAGEVSPDDLGALGRLGYTDQVAREELRRKLAATPVTELLPMLMTFNTPCVERLAIAESLASRPLDEATRAELEAWAGKETSAAVRSALDDH